MQLLLDTHTLIWMIRESERLSSRAKAALEVDDSELFVSSVSAFELSTKYRQGKMPEAARIFANYEDTLLRICARELPLTSRHALLAGSFTQVHGDPFDRMLAAQSILENIPLVSKDHAMDSFGIQRFW